MALFGNNDVWRQVELYFTPLERITIASVCKATSKPSSPKSKRLRTVDLAARRGYKGIVKWHKSDGLRDSTFVAAAKSGNLKLVKWLKKKRCYCCSPAGIEGAAKHGHRNILKWYAVNYPFMLDKNVLYKAVIHNQVKIVKWFFWLKEGENFERAMEIAIKNGHDEIFSWCAKRGCRISKKAFTRVLRRGNLKLAKICVKKAKGLLPNFCSAMWAALGGNLEVLKLCVENGSEITSYYVLSRAIHNNDFLMVQWLVEQGAKIEPYSIEEAGKLKDQTIYNYLTSQ